VVNFLMEYVKYSLGPLFCLIIITACGAIKHSRLDLRIGVWGPKRGIIIFVPSTTWQRSNIWEEQ
jgi:hypothetical protein